MGTMQRRKRILRQMAADLNTRTELSCTARNGSPGEMMKALSVALSHIQANLAKRPGRQQGQPGIVVRLDDVTIDPAQAEKWRAALRECGVQFSKD